MSDIITLARKEDKTEEELSLLYSLIDLEKDANVLYEVFLPYINKIQPIIRKRFPLVPKQDIHQDSYIVFHKLVDDYIPMLSSFTYYVKNMFVRRLIWYIKKTNKHLDKEVSQDISTYADLKHIDDIDYYLFHKEFESFLDILIKKMKLNPKQPVK